MCEWSGGIAIGACACVCELVPVQVQVQVCAFVSGNHVVGMFFVVRWIALKMFLIFFLSLKLKY